MLFGEQVHLHPFFLQPRSAGSCLRRCAEYPAGWRQAGTEVPVFWRDLEEPRVRARSPMQWRQHPWAPHSAPVGFHRCAAAAATAAAAGETASGNRPQTGRPTPDSRPRPSQSEKKTPEGEAPVKGTVVAKDECSPWRANIDMSDFRPEDVNVAALDGGFRMDATRVMPLRGGGAFQMQVSRDVKMPEHVDKKNIRIWLGTDGILHFAEKAANPSNQRTNPTQAPNSAKEDDPKEVNSTVEKLQETASQSCKSDSNLRDISLTPKAVTPSDSTLQNADAVTTDPASKTETDTDAIRGVQAPERSVPITIPVEQTTDDTPTSDGHNALIEMEDANNVTDKMEVTNDVHNSIEHINDAHEDIHKVDTVNETVFKMEDLTDVTNTKDDVVPHDVSEEMENKYDVITMDDVNDVTSNMDAETDVSDELPELVNYVTSNEDLILTQSKDAPFRKCMDVSGFDPNDLVIKFVDRTLSVEAERHEDVDGVETLRRISCSFKLPPGVDADSIRSAVTSEGSLTIFGHFESNTTPKEKIVSIQRIA